jgi:hypothetical protein
VDLETHIEYLPRPRQWLIRMWCYCSRLIPPILVMFLAADNRKKRSRSVPAHVYSRQVQPDVVTRGVVQVLVDV